MKFSVHTDYNLHLHNDEQSIELNPELYISNNVTWLEVTEGLNIFGDKEEILEFIESLKKAVESSPYGQR